MVVFGDLDGVDLGQDFPNRAAVKAAGLHRHVQAGISGASAEGADAIVLSGGYEDDYDRGDVIIYTGEGGRDPSGKHIKDQTLTKGNMALARSYQLGLPVRVIRGAGHKSSWSPISGYRYAGCYYIDQHWHEKGRSGHLVL